MCNAPCQTFVFYTRTISLEGGFHLWHRPGGGGGVHGAIVPPSSWNVPAACFFSFCNEYPSDLDKDQPTR